MVQESFICWMVFEILVKKNNSMMNRNISIVFLLLVSIWTEAQESSDKVYGLQDCITIALENNLTLKSAQLSQDRADVNFRQSKNELLPNINGNYNIGKSNGRSIDPFTNSYVNEQLTFSNASLQLGAVVFNGFRLINRWKQQKLNLEASEMEREEARQNLILDVTLAYLQVMNNRDLYELAQNRYESTQTQLERLENLYEEEMGNPAEFRDFQGLSANDESNIITARNNLEDAKLNLKQLMNTDENFEVANRDLSFSVSEYELSNSEVYNQALQNLSTIKASELRQQASEKAISVAKAEFVPEVSFFANLGTNYSSAARIFNEGATSIVQTGDFITINNEEYPVFSNQTDFIADGISYSDQFENNLNSTVGFSVSIPLFNGFRAKNIVALQKIANQEAEVELERTKLELKTNIEQAHKDMEVAFRRHEILQKQVEAYKESFRINQIRFDNGVTNSAEFIISKNNLDNALINLSNVKYEYLLRVKVLDYYTGLNLN